MKKIVSIILSAALLMTCFSGIGFAAETENVIFSDDFNSLAAGSAPATGEGKWSNLVKNDTKKLVITGVKEGDNGVLKIGCDEGGESGGPRIAKKLDLSRFTNLTVTYKFKSDGAKAEFALGTDGKESGSGAKITTLISGTEKEWTEAKVVIDVKKATYDTYVGGKQVAKAKALHEIADLSTADFRFTSVPQPGQHFYIDDVKFTTTDNVDLSAPAETKPGTGATTEMPETGTTPPKAMSVPEGVTIIFKDDFETYLEGAGRNACKGFSGGTTYIKMTSNGENKVMAYYSDDGKAHYPRAEVAIPANSLTKFYIDYAVKPSNSAAYINLHEDKEVIAKNAASITSSTEGVSATEWNYVHITVDLKNMKVTSTVNGKALPDVAITKLDNPSSLIVRIEAGIQQTDMVYWDNMVIYTDDKIKYDGVMIPGNKVAWDNVKPTKPLSKDSFVNNLVDHPRMIVSSWDDVRTKINATYEASKWYENIKSVADRALITEPTEHKINTRGNCLESSRTERNRLQCLAFTYGVTGDKKYADRAYEEMLATGEWPDWSAFTATLVTAEIMWGYACAYDWCYDAYTPEQRQKIIDITLEKGLTDFVYNYEGKKTNTNFTTTSINWNPVCNACAIGTAFAFADEIPEISEYVLERAPVFINNALPPYAPNGGYPEGVGYWDYGTTFLVFAMDFLENGFKDGYKLPDNYYYYNSPGIAETCDFPIYYCGPKGKFNYCDASSGSNVSTSIFYWFANKFNKSEYGWYENKVQRDFNTYLSQYDAMAAICWYDPNNASVEPGHFKLDKFYQSETTVNGISMRSTWEGNMGMFAAMYGGDNRANHQYLNLGTYTIDWRNKRFVRHHGESDYALKGAKETIYYKRAEASNTLVCNPSSAPDQKTDAFAKVIASGTSDNTAFGVLDMTKTNDSYISAKRGIMMTDNRRRVIVQDEAQTKSPSEYYWFANTDAAITIAKDGKSAILNDGGERMLVRIIKGPEDAVFTIAARKSLIEGVKNTIGEGTKLSIHMQNVTNLELCVEYVGLDKGEGIPEPWNYVPMDSWKAEDNDPTVVAQLGDAVALKLGTPISIANGYKTYVDPDNYAVVPFETEGRTLVPVRFISESFGAIVGWQDALQKVTINYNDKVIELVLGSNEMKVNDQIITLDVPAQDYNDRTLIPLRALVEALGKKVFWDDRGLIIISDFDMSYSDSTINDIITELNVSVSIGGAAMTFFDSSRDKYTIDLNSTDSVPEVSASTIGSEQISVTQASEAGTSAYVSITSESGTTKTYEIKFNRNAYEGIKSNKDDGVLDKVSISLQKTELPDHLTYIYVEDLLDSTGFATYPKRGSVDGVINTTVANRWAADGEGQWLQFDFGSEKTVHSMAFSGVSQDIRKYNFDVLASNDGENWTTVHTGGVGTTTEWMQVVQLGDVKARYIRVVGHGSQLSTWNTWAELRFYDSAAQEAEDISYWPAYFGSKGIKGKAGTTTKLLISGIDYNKKEFELSADAQITIKVGDASVATVDGTNITFVKPGKTTITATVTEGGITKTETAEVVCE